MLPFRDLSVCMSRSYFMLKRQKISTRVLFAFDSPMSLPDRVKIWLTSVNPFLPKFCPSDPAPVDLSVGDTQQQIAAEWLEIAQT